MPSFPLSAFCSKDISVTCSQYATLRGNKSLVILWIILHTGGASHVGEGTRKDASCPRTTGKHEAGDRLSLSS